MNLKINEAEKYNLLSFEDKKLTNIDAPSFKALLVGLAQKNKAVVCDLKNLDYMDSSGLSSLLIGNRLFKEKDLLFVICNISDKIYKLIELTKLDKILLIIETENEAKDYIMMNELEKNL